MTYFVWKKEIEIEHINIKSILVYYIKINDIKFEYFENTNINIRRCNSKTENHNIYELVLEIWITKFLSFEYLILNKKAIFNWICSELDELSKFKAFIIMI